MEITLLLSIALVIMVVFVFLRNVRATMIPSVAVPLSLLGTFGVMYLLGYSLDNLSLMALTISTGFVVDDAIVVIENIIALSANRECPPIAAALKGASEIGFTVLSMSISLIAVFIPILLMGGIVGPPVPGVRRDAGGCCRCFHGGFPDDNADDVRRFPAIRARPQTQLGVPRERAGLRVDFEDVRAHAGLGVAPSADHAGRSSVTIALNVYLYVIVPKGFFPQQDTGRLMGSVSGDRRTSRSLPCGPRWSSSSTS